MSVVYETPFNKAVLETLQNIAAALEGIRYQLSTIAAPLQSANKPVDPSCILTRTESQDPQNPQNG